MDRGTIAIDADQHASPEPLRSSPSQNGQPPLLALTSSNFEILDSEDAISSSPNYSKAEQRLRTKNYRSHAFQRLSCPQCIGLIQIGLTLLTFYGFTFRAFPSHSNDQHIFQLFIDPNTKGLIFNFMYFLAEIVYPFIFAIAFVFFALLSFKDAGIKLSNKRQSKSVANLNNADKFWCYLCKEVRESGTKHCYDCFKCVQDFDHHCPFLNVCIGSKNYSFFVYFCTFMEILCCLQIAIQLFVWWEFDNYGFEAHYNMSRSVYKGFVIFPVILPVVFSVSLFSLLHFHAYLAHKGYTTFEWILRKRQRQAKKRLNNYKMKHNKVRNESGTHSITLHEVKRNSSAIEAMDKINNEFSKFSSAHRSIEKRCEIKINAETKEEEEAEAPEKPTKR